jgi:hypothetical protein
LLSHKHLKQHLLIHSSSAVTVAVTAGPSVRIVNVLLVDPLVVPPPLLGIGQDLVGKVDFPKGGFGLLLFFFRSLLSIGLFVLELQYTTK